MTMLTARTRSCAEDLLTNGIDVREMPDRSLRALIANERDYFQLMLGGDEPTDREIFRLLRDTGPSRGPVQRRPRARRSRPC